MKKFLSLFLTTSLFLNTASYATAGADYNFGKDKDSIGVAVTRAVDNEDRSNTGNESLIQFLKQKLENSIKDNTEVANLSETEKEMYADLFTVIYSNTFSQDEVTDLSNFIKYHLSTNQTSDVLYMFAGVFLSHKDFYSLRDSMVYSLYITRAKDSERVEALTPFIRALKDTPNLDLFLSESHQYNIVNLLRAQIDSLSYLGGQDYYKSLLEKSIIKKEGYRNESVALRSFLEAESWFTPKEDDSFWKGLVTVIAPVQRPWPGRGIDGDFMDNDSGRAHSLAFDIIDILMRHYILTGQDDKVYSFIENEGLRQGPYYFQFAIDGLSLANAYYLSLENAEARQSKWDETQNYFIKTFKKESPMAQKILVFSSRVSQLSFEYYIIGEAFKFAGKKVISPFAKFCLQLLPKSVQIKVLTKSYLIRGYVRQGMQKYLSDKPKYLYTKFLNKVGSKELIFAHQGRIGTGKGFLKESLKRAGFAENSEIYKFFTKELNLRFAVEDDATFNYLKNATEYISKEDLESFYRIYKKIPNSYKKMGAVQNPCTIVVVNGKIVPKIETPVISNEGKIVNKLRELLSGSARVIRAERGEGGQLFSIVQLRDGSVIRFGNHEINNGTLHIHFEKIVSEGGASFILNQSYVVSTEESLRVFASENFRYVWALSSKPQKDTFISALFNVAKNDNLKAAADQEINNLTKQYIYRLNTYFFDITESRRLTAVEQMMRMTGAITEEDAVNEIIVRVLQGASDANNGVLYSIYRDRLLNRVLNDIATNMTNEEAAMLLQRTILENISNPSFKGFHAASVAAAKGNASGDYIPW